HMLRKFVCAAVITVIGLSVAVADDFLATITKVEGDKVTFKKGGFGGFKKKDPDAPPAKEENLPVAKAVKITKSKGFDMEAKKLQAGDTIENGLKNEMFSKEKIAESKGGGVFAQITTSDDNKTITAITTGGFGGKGKGFKKKDAE